MPCNIQFACSRKWPKGRDKHCTKFLTPLSQNLVGEFWYLAWFVFYARLNFGVQKNIAPVPSFVYNTRKNGKNQYRRRGFWATLYGNILPKFKLKWLKIRCTRTLNVRPSSWKYSLEKTSKTASETFFRLNEIKSKRRGNNNLQFTNKRLNLLHNNSAQMLTRQDVK